MEIKTKYSIDELVYFECSQGVGYGYINDITISKTYGENGFLLSFTYNLKSTTGNKIGTFRESAISSTPEEAMKKLKAEARKRYDERIAEIDKMSTKEGIDNYNKSQAWM